MATDYKARLREQASRGVAQVFTDPRASPTSFPLKVAQLDGTLSRDAVYDGRTRVCHLGYLREAYRTPDGTIGFRCPAEPVSVYVAKGGRAEDTLGRKCICNALVATMGHPQVRGRRLEPPIITSGNALDSIVQFAPAGTTSYRAANVIARLLADAQA